MESQDVLALFERACMAGTQKEFLAVFIDQLAEKTDLSSSAYFELDALKTKLTLLASSVPGLQKGTFVFPLHDTDNPVVYSLIASCEYRVSKPQALRSNDAELKSLIQHSVSGDAMFCSPVVFGTGGQGVFVLFGQTEVIERIETCATHRRLLRLAGRLLGVYDLAWRKDREKQALKNGLDQISRDTAQQAARARISGQYIGRSKRIKQVCDLITRASASDVAVLLRGETGVGKDLAASLIHQHSARSRSRFMVVNCAAIPDQLLESELFGHCKGAFSGADRDKKGLIKQADGGSLFLDEIGDLSHALQAKLLRVLQEKRFTPVGASKEEASDFRLITATHRPLEHWIAKDRFRRDLFYRINQFMISIPSLSERQADIPQLVDHFVNRYMQEYSVHISGFDESALEMLVQYPFPGNIRELKNIVFQACMFADADNRISAENMRSRLAALSNTHDLEVFDEVASGKVVALNSGQTLPQATDRFEQNLIRVALRNAGGSRSRAADALGIPKRTLAHKCKKWSICHGD